MTALSARSLPDSTVALLRDGYAFVGRQCERRRAEVFETRLFGVPVICMRGREAARLLYTDPRLTRKDGMPSRVLHTLMGTDGVQTLDGGHHHHRKQLFLSLLGPQSGAAAFVDTAVRHWRAQLPAWERADAVVLHDEMARILTAGTCEWAGIPLPADRVADRAAEQMLLIESAAALGPRHWRGRLARAHSQDWLGELIEQVRAGTLTVPTDSALHQVATFHDVDGALLPRHTAAVELLNVLRPAVAVARFVVFIAMALHSHPRLARQLRDFDEASTEVGHFVQEVRRTTPFFPAVAARVRTPFNWNGMSFPQGRLVMLDLYATDHDPRHWTEAETFMPARFDSWDGDAYDLVPQGAGEHAGTHRCPGEWFTTGFMRRAVGILLHEIDYDVPAQDLRVSLRRAPALPRSGFVMANVHRVG